MLGALRSLFGKRHDGGHVAPPHPVETTPATFEEVAAGDDGAVPLRRVYELDPDAAAVLREIGMPEDIARTVFQAEPEYSFPIRDTDKPRHAARRFLIFMRAMDWRGEFRADEVLDMYEHFCLYDHRHPLQNNLFLNALDACPGVSKKRPVLEGGKRDSRWLYTIKPRPFSKAIGLALTKTPRTELPENVVALQAVRQAQARDRRRFARRRHRQRSRRAA